MSQLISTPILLEHYWDDPVIAVSNARPMRLVLGFLDFRVVEWHSYDEGGHWVNEPGGIDDFVRFLRRITEK